MLEFNEKQCDVLGDCRVGQFLLYESSNWKPLSSLSISRISRVWSRAAASGQGSLLTKPLTPPLFCVLCLLLTDLCVL